ncbi:hypothetical protein Bca101_027827 [Brassica carinata]
MDFALQYMEAWYITLNAIQENGLSLLPTLTVSGCWRLVEGPLIPTDKKYQGTNSTFVFTDKSRQPTIYCPTGANRFYTLCSKDFLALRSGGVHKPIIKVYKCL